MVDGTDGIVKIDIVTLDIIIGIATICKIRITTNNIVMSKNVYIYLFIAIDQLKDTTQEHL